MPKYGLTVVTPQTGEIFAATDESVQAALRIDTADVDATLIGLYITAAREYVEERTGRQFLTAQYLLTFDNFPGIFEDEYRPLGWRYGQIRIPRPPLVSIDRVQYIDTNGVLQTLAQTNDPITGGGWQVSTKKFPGILAPQRFQVWPIADPQSLDAVQITFTAGYGATANVPQRIQQAIRFLIGHLYANREGTVESSLANIPYGVEQFIANIGTGEYV
jgi:uncharacterized phiE125 gp8 family phage protein